MLKSNLTTKTAYKAVEDNFVDAATAVVTLDLPEDKFMLQLSVATVWNYGVAVLSPTNFDRFNLLID
mgnify:CR=1 FL=1|tara:strand:- start:5064 stop:5264 length:201 start_codon:yes stop_codon:yes gene_type:complete